MNGSWDAYLAPPADFAVAGDIITDLAKKKEPRIEIIERTPLSSIVQYWLLIIHTVLNGQMFLLIIEKVAHDSPL